MDGFDQLPDSLILLIFNSVSDIKTLLRCRAVSRRFNSLVPQTDSLLLKVDCVVSPDSADHDGDDSFLFTFLKSILKSLHNLVSPNPLSPSQKPPQNSPSKILRGFDRVRDLEIELPSGDLRLKKGAVVKWTAEFGNSLRSCVILGFRAIRDSSVTAEIGADPAGGEEEEDDFARGLKTRVVWTISALIAASARHYLLREVVREQSELRRLVLTDREGEGTVVMDEAGLAELRSGTAELAEHVSGGGGGEEEDEDDVAERNRTRVPSVRMRMRHAPRLELKGGLWAEGATLVVVRPTTTIKEGSGGGAQTQLGDDVAEADLATRAFGEGLYGEAVGALLKSRTYILEMNSF
ncbi:hypothetical protein TIFTF001_014496 [Ficus carica]|uniref:F-box domain-containing protein n=1 Tax=Ficus carica TaxID=3494 RepID=A0AA88A407_FICCA|nr:hypothetical protein TIFTF001_014496 [Ficus carica]